MLYTLSRWNLWTWNIAPQCFFLVNFSSRNNMILHFISLLNLQRISYSITNCIHNSNMVAIISKRLFTLRVVMAVWFWINVKEVDYPNGYWHPGDWKSHTLSPTCRSRYFFHLHRLRSCAESVFYTTSSFHPASSPHSRLSWWMLRGEAEWKSLWHFSLWILSYFLIFIRGILASYYRQHYKCSQGARYLHFLETSIKLNLFGAHVHPSKYECALTKTLYNQYEKGKNVQLKQIIIHIWFAFYRKLSKSLSQR